MLKNFDTYNYPSHQDNTAESYRIVLNSNLSTGTVNDALFNFDWSVLPDRNYLVSYAFNTANMSISTGKVCLISSDVFTTQNTFFATGQDTRTSAQTSNLIGCAYPYVYGAASSLHADDSTSPPLYLNTRPNSNLFTVSIKTADATPIDYPSLGAWVLILHFTPVDRSGRQLL